jgi:hypothetical protein
MIDVKMTNELFSNVKTPLLITIFIVLLIIFITIYFVSKEVKK